MLLNFTHANGKKYYEKVRFLMYKSVFYGYPVEN